MGNAIDGFYRGDCDDIETAIVGSHREMTEEEYAHDHDDVAAGNRLSQLRVSYLVFFLVRFLHIAAYREIFRQYDNWHFTIDREFFGVVQHSKDVFYKKKIKRIGNRFFIDLFGNVKEVTEKNMEDTRQHHNHEMALAKEYRKNNNIRMWSACILQSSRCRLCLQLNGHKWTKETCLFLNCLGYIQAILIELP